jgi:arsenate reductase
MNLLFLCVANSARSQLAEALARRMLGPQAQVHSAGSKPARINPLAVDVLKEVGISAEAQFSKGVDQLPAEVLEKLTLVITLCHEEVCPPLPRGVEKLHWPITDPAIQTGSREEQLHRFRVARDAIHEKLLGFAQARGLPLLPIQPTMRLDRPAT